VAQKYTKFIDNAALGRGCLLHDDCYAMVDAKVKDYGIKVPFKYMHLLEYLRNYLRDNRSKITRLGVSVAYQRPCASRYTPAKDVFVDEIFELIGVQRPARKYEREDALCCTGAFVKVYPQLALDMQAKNVDDALQAGADALITLCPMCDRVLRRPTTERGLRKVYITDLCMVNERDFSQVLPVKIRTRTDFLCPNRGVSRQHNSHLQAGKQVFSFRRFGDVSGRCPSSV
jgi:Fe-S oxidoreductase